MRGSRRKAMEKKRSGPVRPAEKAEPVQEVVGLTDLLLIGAAIAGALAAFGLIWKRIVRR